MNEQEWSDECEYVAGCAEAASFRATPISKTHDFQVKHSCVRHLGKVIKYEDDPVIDYWTVEAR